MPTAFVAHSRLSYPSPACPEKEFQFCSVTKVCELLRSITHRGYGRDRSNWRLIWRGPGVGTPLVLSQGEVHERYTEGGDPATHPVSTRNNGARGGSRTHMRKNPRRILSPQRLPFRHPG